jgi:hypothetical protein
VTVREKGLPATVPETASRRNRFAAPGATWMEAARATTPSPATSSCVPAVLRASAEKVKAPASAAEKVWLPRVRA